MPEKKKPRRAVGAAGAKGHINSDPLFIRPKPRKATPQWERSDWGWFARHPTRRWRARRRFPGETGLAEYGDHVVVHKRRFDVLEKLSFLTPTDPTSLDDAEIVERIRGSMRAIENGTFLEIFLALLAPEGSA